MTEKSATCAVTLRLVAIPSNTPEGDDLYVAGTFNDWKTSDPAMRMTEHSDGSWSVTIRAAAGDRIEYKFNRGDWDTAETRADTGMLENRFAVVREDGQEIHHEVAGWHDHGNLVASDYGVTGAVEILRGFYMPQFGWNRRVWVYLPPGYEDNAKRYPVLYMHDGQNLFDPKESSFGVWHVGEAMERLFEKHESDGVIVVAPDNGGANRLNEYSPFHDPEHNAGGAGAAYMDFLVNTLKPYVDENFRTRPEREYTGIAGSSMGGLISLWGGLAYPETFSKIGAFSSAFWFANRKLFDHVRDWGKNGTLRRAGSTWVYLDVGGREGHDPQTEKTQVHDTIDMYYLLQELGIPDDETKLVLDAKATHSEPEWARRFGDAYAWLFERK